MLARAPSKSNRGFTLIEVILVVAIIAVVVTGATFGLGAVTRTRLRSASFRVVSAARFAYNRAITQGTTTRHIKILQGGTTQRKACRRGEALSETACVELQRKSAPRSRGSTKWKEVDSISIIPGFRNAN